MAHLVCEVFLTEKPLVAPEWCGLQETGAIIDFWGIVRSDEDGTEISGIRYESHGAMAEHQLRRLAAEAAERFRATVQIWHRTAFVPVGEASLLVRVGSRHRAAAFAAGEWIVDELKKRVPIWKHPRFTQPAPDFRGRDQLSTSRTSPA